MKLRLLNTGLLSLSLFACGGVVEKVDGSEGDGDFRNPGGREPGGVLPPGEDPGGVRDPDGWVDPGEEPGVNIPPGGVEIPGGGVLPPIDPATCETDYEWNDGDYCEREAQCGDAWAYASCDSWDGEAQCWCDREGLGISINIDPGLISSGDACERVLDACLGATTIEPTGETTCSPEYLDQEDDYCGTNLSCTTPVTVGGLPADIQTWSDAWCENWNGEWSCECYSGNTSGRIVFSDNQSSPEVCYSSIDVCADGLLDPNQPSECRPRSQWADEGHCSFELECSQDRLVGGSPAEVSAWQYGSCSDTGMGSWQCACGNGEVFEMPGTDEWSVCTTAAAECSN